MSVMSVDKTDELFQQSSKQYILCSSFEEACDCLASVVDSAALDFETTSLDPKDGRIRLTSICNDEVHFVIDHEFLGPLSDYDLYFRDRVWYVYNSKFETRWLDTNLNFEVEVKDVDFMAKAVLGGHPTSLAAMCKRDLGVDLDKDEQNSGWANPTLTQRQLDYSAFDSFVTWKLVKYWRAKWLNAAEHINKNGFGHIPPDYARGAEVFDSAVRATTEAERTGLMLDTPYHSKLVALWERKFRTHEKYLRRFTPPSIIENLNSTAQIAKFLKQELPKDMLAAWPVTEKTKAMQIEGAYLRQVARLVSYPMNRWLAALVGYKYYSKYLSTYGETLITKQNLSGKVTTRFNIAQAATGRYSSSSSNLQNIPRKTVVRRSFYSPPKGTDVMCLADYSSIEVRVLAELSGDTALLYDAIYGDVHATSFAAIEKLDKEHVHAVLNAKDDTHPEYKRFKKGRSDKKPFTFQLTYGAGYAALALILRCSYDGAVDAVRAWAEQYPKAYGYRDKMFDMMNATGYLPVCDGRTIYVWRAERSMPVAANYPIQAAAASVMYRAMFHVRRLFVEHDVDAVIAATVHDELLSYAHRDHAEQAMTLQLEGMRLGWLDIFPDTNTDNLTDHKIGMSWADKP